MSAAAARVLDRMRNVKQTRPDNWVGGCPCCQSKRGRPVSVRAVDDRVLIYPFCGCSTDAVVEALGLTLTDLYDAPIGHANKPSHSRISARDLLDLISHEVDVAVIVVAEMLETKAVDDGAWQRLAAAARRIGYARDHA